MTPARLSYADPRLLCEEEPLHATPFMACSGGGFGRLKIGCDLRLITRAGNEETAEAVKTFPFAVGED
jgi:hypothetical protein